MSETLSNHKIAIVIPYYNSSKIICDVIKSIPTYINFVILIDDCSQEELPKSAVLASINAQTQVCFLKTETNLGVGGATKLGFKKAIEFEVDFVIKIDSDNQMDLQYLPKMLEILIKKEAHFVKGNRFRDFKALQKMPFVRRFGNLILSFLIKMATGYWHVFDPTNGYFAIKANVLNKVDFEKLSNRYFFETSLLSELYFQSTCIKDVSMPAIYNDEKSSMKVWQMPFVFSLKLLKLFIKRIVKMYFIFDFNIASIYLIFGLPLFLFGFFYGIYTWVYYSSLQIYAPTGTIMLVTLSIILGFQLLLQAIQYDIMQSPKDTK